jgi:hypothetical protein
MILKKALQIVEGWGKLTLQELNIIGESPISVRRLATCIECPNLVEGKCTLCGCVMQAKVLVSSATCPLNKWHS